MRDLGAWSEAKLIREAERLVKELDELQGEAIKRDFDVFVKNANKHDREVSALPARERVNRLHERIERGDLLFRLPEPRPRRLCQ